MAHRYVVECVWSGYRSEQARPVHRRVISGRAVDRYKAITGIQNTTMSVSVRECEPRERVAEIRGYDTLLSQIISKGRTGFVRVADLRD